MRYVLEDEFLQVEIDNTGAELKKIEDKSDGYQYLWQGDSIFWDKSAPILFPIVGNLNKGKYIYDGNEYFMSRHGFAAAMDFQMQEYSHKAITFSLTHNSVTLSQYPFEFQLLVSYSLNERTLTTTFRVVNTGKKKMWFSIGGHPGFNCSMGVQGKKNGTLSFEYSETAKRIINETGYLIGREEVFFENTNTVNLYSMFNNDKAKVYIFQGLKSESVTLNNEPAGKLVEVNFGGFPYLGIWSPSARAPFICIEPWYGVTSTIGQKDILNEKRGILSLEKERSFQCKYEIICK